GPELPVIARGAMVALAPPPAPPLAEPLAELEPPVASPMMTKLAPEETRTSPPSPPLTVMSPPSPPDPPGRLRVVGWGAFGGGAVVAGRQPAQQLDRRREAGFAGHAEGGHQPNLAPASHAHSSLPPCALRTRHGDAKRLPYKDAAF